MAWKTLIHPVAIVTPWALVIAAGFLFREVLRRSRRCLAPCFPCWHCFKKQIKALAPARLEAFSKGFRAAFHVPEAQPPWRG